MDHISGASILDYMLMLSFDLNCALEKDTVRCPDRETKIQHGQRA